MRILPVCALRVLIQDRTYAVVNKIRLNIRPSTVVHRGDLQLASQVTADQYHVVFIGMLSEQDAENRVQRTA